MRVLDHGTLGVILAMALAAMLFGVGMIEKHERKIKPVKFGSCYIMHDKIVTCPMP